MLTLAYVTTMLYLANSATKQASEFSLNSQFECITHDLNCRYHFLARKCTRHKHPGQLSSLTILIKGSHAKQASEHSVSCLIYIFLTHLTVRQWPFALPELHCLAVLDCTRRKAKHRLSFLHVYVSLVMFVLLHSLALLWYYGYYNEIHGLHDPFHSHS